MHNFLFQLDKISRLTNQRNNIWIIVFKFAKFFMIFLSNFVFFYSRSYLFQSFVYHTLFFNHVIRKFSLNHIFRDFDHFFACFNDQRRIINIIRFKKKKLKAIILTKQSDETKKINFKELQKMKRIIIEIKIKLNIKIFEFFVNEINFFFLFLCSRANEWLIQESISKNENL
jgi:hypothetical protein